VKIPILHKKSSPKYLDIYPGEFPRTFPVKNLKKINFAPAGKALPNCQLSVTAIRLLVVCKLEPFKTQTGFVPVK